MPVNNNAIRANLGTRFAAVAVAAVALSWFVSIVLMRCDVIDVKRWDGLPIVPWLAWATAPWTCLAGAGILAAYYLKNRKRDTAFVLGGILVGLSPMLLIYYFWVIGW